MDTAHVSAAGYIICFDAQLGVDKGRKESEKSVLEGHENTQSENLTKQSLPCTELGYGYPYSLKGRQGFCGML